MNNDVNVLRLSLHGETVGYLAGYRNGTNLTIFSDRYRLDSGRSTFSLTTHPGFPRANELMSQPWSRTKQLHPILSNLLPEGSLRQLISETLKVHPDNEFQIFSFLGGDLPGAIVAEYLEPKNVPPQVLGILTSGDDKHSQVIPFDQSMAEKLEFANKFSLAGVQMKFSMKEKEGRYNLSRSGALGDWIIKTPSTQHRDVPVNEYTAMSLASLVGIDIPEIKLVELDKLDNLPPINLPDEQSAFAIKRFDRKTSPTLEGVDRVHMEDFAQVLVKYPHEKYNSANYEQIGRVLYDFSGDSLTDVQQFSRRLLVNILLANGDAHLKNWSLLYHDKITPRLSPAYDIVTTKVYIEGEKQFALNLGKTKDWYEVSFSHFKYWSERSGIPWRVIRPHLEETVELARTLWPAALNDLPMNDAHKTQLKEHWRNLQSDFKILSEN